MKVSKSQSIFLPVLLFAAFVCVHCKNAFSTDFSIDAVFFENMPSTKSSLEASLVDYHDTLKILKNDADAINSLKQVYAIRIVGHTDNKECVGRGCESLSLRRAQLIYKWMLANGVPQNRLLPPEGCGSNEPVANNDIPQGRVRNRYVEFQVIPEKRLDLVK